MFENRIFLVELLEHLAFRFGQAFFHTVQEQRRLVQQPLERSDVFDDNRFRQTSELGFLFKAEVLSCVNDDRNVAKLRLDLLHQVESVHIGQAQVEHDAVVMFAAQLGHRFFARADGNCLNVTLSDQFLDALLRDRIVFDNQQALDAALNEAFDPSERIAELFRSRWFVFERHRSHLQPALAFFSDGDDVHRDMPCVLRMLQTVEHTPSVHARQLYIQSDCRGRVLASQRQPGVAACGDNRLETALACHLHDDFREIQVVLDNQQRAVAGLDTGTIVIHGILDDERDFYFGLPRLRDGLVGNLSARMRPPLSFVHIRRIRCGQIQRERAAFAGRAVQPDFSAKQSRNLATNGEAEAGPSVLPCDGPVCLLERLENDLVFVGRNADPGIDH